VFFPTREELRAWFSENHAAVRELWVGYYKKDSGKPSVTWPESVDEALCVGWIDGIRKRIDEDAYTIRFTPRRPSSHWSAVNIRRAQELTREGRMQQAGLKAFETRKENRPGRYSYEQRPAELPEPYAGRLRENKAAWEFLQRQPPSYRKVSAWWVMSAKLEETRLKRLEQLAEWSAQGRRLGR
jgi:uncharacterized protein YdeI (YjbR/CyaY-like superfamily)